MNDWIYKIPLIYADDHSFSVLNSIFLPYLTRQVYYAVNQCYWQIDSGEDSWVQNWEIWHVTTKFFLCLLCKKRDKTNDGAWWEIFIWVKYWCNFKLKVVVLHQSNEQINRLFVVTKGSVYMAGNNVNTMERVVNKSHLESETWFKHFLFH